MEDVPLKLKADNLACMKKILLPILLLLLLLGLAQIGYLSLNLHFLFSYLAFFLFTIIVIKKKLVTWQKALYLLPSILIFWYVLALLIDNRFRVSVDTFFYNNLGLPSLIAELIGIYLGILFCASKVKRFIPIGLFGLISFFFFLGNKSIIDKWLHFLNFRTFSGIVQVKEPKWQAILPDSQVINQGTYADKILIMDFWYSACGACFRDFPVFDSLRKHYENDSTFVFYSINNLLRGETPEEIFSLIKKENFGFQVAIMDSTSISALDISKYPTILIIKDKQIRYRGDVHQVGQFLESLKNEELPLAQH